MMHSLNSPVRSAVRLPANNYPLWDALPSEVVNSKLSSLQLEGVISACNMHQRILASGERAGFFIGGAAGGGLRPLACQVTVPHLGGFTLTPCLPLLQVTVPVWARGGRLRAPLSTTGPGGAGAVAGCLEGSATAFAKHLRISLCPNTAPQAARVGVHLHGPAPGCHAGLP